MKKEIAWLPIALSSLMLVACGGGDDGGTPAPAPPPVAPAPIIYQPVTSVPPAVYPDARRQQVFSRINELRQQVGLGLFAQSVQIDRAAENHARCTITAGCPNGPHGELRGAPGFTGVNSLERINATGFGAENSTEGLSFDGDLTGKEMVDYQINSVYHRVAFFDHRWTHIGLGWVDRPSYPLNTIGSINFVFDWAYPFNSRQGAPNTLYVVWPQPNSIVSAVERTPETPAPPGKGYPISIQVDPEKTLQVRKFELREANGAMVQANLLTHETDENLAAAKNKFFAALSPQVALKSLTNYTVLFDGNIDDQPLTVSWSFSTPNCRQISISIWECK